MKTCIHLLVLVDRLRLLSADAQAFRQGHVALEIIAAYVGQQAAALPNQFQQSTARGFVVGIRAEMIGQLLNPGGQQSGSGLL